MYKHKSRLMVDTNVSGHTAICTVHKKWARAVLRAVQEAFGSHPDFQLDEQLSGDQAELVCIRADQDLVDKVTIFADGYLRGVEDSKRGMTSICEQIKP